METGNQVSRYVEQNVKESVLLGGSESSLYREVEVLEIAPSINRTSKLKASGQKEEAVSNFSIGLDGIAKNGSLTDFQSPANVVSRLHDSMNIDDFYSSLNSPEDDYFDDVLDDEYALLESPFDPIDLFPGIDVSVPLVPSSPKNKTKVSVASTGSKSSLLQQSDEATMAPVLNSSNSSWPLPSTPVSKLLMSRKKLTVDTQANIGTQPSKVEVKLPLGQRKPSTSSSNSLLHLNPQSSVGSFMPVKEPFHTFNKSKSRTRAPHVFHSGSSHRFSSDVNDPSFVSYDTISYTPNLPINTHFVEPYVPLLEDLPANAMEPSADQVSWGFVSEFVPWAHDASNSQNGECTVTSVFPTIVQRNMEEVMQNFKIFGNFDTVDDYSDHCYKTVSSAKQPTQIWAKKVQEEWKILEKDLPDTIFVRVYENRMDLLRAVIVGAEGTPYHDGLFFFDVCFPSTYPNDPPLVHYHSGGLRINPNLYSSGKVCLSLLNTWTGYEKEMWIPGVSTVLQVLVSIQALILNSKPYFNEPGYAIMSGSASGEKQSLEYNENVFIYSLQTMVYSMRRPPMHFKDFVIGHYFKHARDLLVSCKAYLDGAQVGSLASGRIQDVDEGDKSCSSHFKTNLESFIPALVNTLSQIGVKDAEGFLPSSTSSSSQKDSGPEPCDAPLSSPQVLQS